MKKLLVLAMMATLLMAGSAFAVNRTLTPVPNATFSFGAPGVASGPTTTNNDDSCDIGVAPAATLLLPYFEVDFTNRTQDTLSRSRTPAVFRRSPTRPFGRTGHIRSSTSTFT
jgi:hypothetical protein